MGYPLRFSGATDLGLAVNLEYEGVTLPARFTTEVTFRTLGEQFLLAPTREVNEIILGCLGRALHLYPGVQKSLSK